jgi:hypothetical protein
MLVSFFEIRILYSHPMIKLLFLEFGDNIPKYQQLEGGGQDSKTVICCVDNRVDVELICHQYNIACLHLYDCDADIDEKEYNSTYEVEDSYEYGYRLSKRPIEIPYESPLPPIETPVVETPLDESPSIYNTQYCCCGWDICRLLRNQK